MPVRKLLIESAYGFGDAVFNVPLIEALANQIGDKVGIACYPHVADAFINIPCVDEVIHIDSLWGGSDIAKQSGYKDYKQITQNAYFFDFKNDPSHSLIDTPKCVGRRYGIELESQRPKIYLTDEEMKLRSGYYDGIRSIALESHYKSGQSWAGAKQFQQIVDKFAKTHRIMMLSPETPLPNLPAGSVGFDDMKRWTRRQCLAALTTCEYFFNVGSGFFCASLSFPPELQPKRNICMWIDGLYRYQDRLKELNWTSIDWANDEAQFNTIMDGIVI